MLRKFYCLACFVCFTSVSFCQTNDSSYGTVITKTQQGPTGGDTSRYLYVRNKNDDCLTVYTIAGGVVSEGTTYRLGASGRSLWLYSRSVLSDGHTTDSVSIDLQDKTNTIIINKQDQYQLFPDAYARFKEETTRKHSIMALLHLLSDGLGDYPISATLLLVNYRPVVAKQIKQAIIKTRRSQADMIDTWICRYFYNSSQKLDSMVARSAEETRFTKKVRYQKEGLVRINTYLDIESRQTTNRSILYDRYERAAVKWRENYLETGKNRESSSSITLTWHDLGMMRNQEPTNAEIIKMLKPPTQTGYTKSMSGN
jgi:hypothetical protein